MKPSSPRRINMRWTCKLIWRDVKTLLSPSKAAKNRSFVSTRVSQGLAVNANIAQAEVSNPVTVSPASTACTSVAVGDERSPHASTAMTLPTDYSTTQGSRADSVTNLYELLEGNLKTLYATRDRDATLEDRWQFRGSHLLLNLAAQACPSNPIYDLFRKQKPNESALLLSILQRHANNLNAADSQRQPMSPLPAIPYSKPNNDHTRYDSAFSTVSDHSYPSLAPTVSELWHTIFEGTCDRNKTVAAATAIIEAACPEVVALDVLEQLGNPSLKFHQEDKLGERLRERLFAGYDDLIHSSNSSILKVQLSK